MSSISSIVGGAPASSSGGASRSTMGKDEFLKLLTTQLANQDPLAPMDNYQFASQLAQFSSLEQLIGVNTGLDQLSLLQQANQSTQAVGFVGRQITAGGNWYDVPVGGAPPGVALQLGADATTIDVEVRDASGTLVGRGTATGHWSDGFVELRAGDIVWEKIPPAGNHTFQVTAKGADDEEVPAAARVRGRVTGVDYSTGMPLLQLGGHGVGFNEIASVEEPASAL